MKAHRLKLTIMAVLLVSLSLQAQHVKVTPLGERTGELCVADRAMLFEDPTGVRILYDPGKTVRGSSDPRLGEVHAILLSHVHSDHLGDTRMTQDPDDPKAVCDGSVPSASAIPNSNLAEIAANKNSAVIVTGDVAPFLGRKIQNIRGVATPGCPSAGLNNELVVPRPAPCTSGIGFGANRTVTLAPGAPGVRIALVTAEHGNGLSPNFLSEPTRTQLLQDNLTLTIGPPVGYVLTFSNGLVVYLSGDTGQTADMAAVVRGFYGAKLAVINVSDTFVTGPKEAAFAIGNLVRANAAIPSHVNEVATTNGRVVPGTRTSAFVQLMDDIPVHIPRSGITMEFDAAGRCRAGCGADSRDRNDRENRR